MKKYIKKLVKQEQIEKMSNIITDCLCKDCVDCKYYNGHFCTEKNMGKAEVLMQAGYGDIKQAQIDVLNKIKERAVGLAAIESFHICNLIDELISEV